MRYLAPKGRRSGGREPKLVSKDLEAMSRREEKTQIRQEMASDKICFLREFSFEDLRRFTNEFSEENFIGKTQFGKVYHGMISHDPNAMEAQHVTVKIWVDHEIYRVQPGQKIWRMKEELELLNHRDLNSHPNMVKLIGYCCEGEQVGVVYDLRSLGTVYSLTFKDSFNWLQRIKAAVGFACVLDFLHNSKHGCRGYLVRNISPAHIMLDEEFCPRLFDFGMLSGGLLIDKTNIKSEKLYGCHGYSDPVWAKPGTWSQICDVFSYGSVLIGLITERVFNEEEMLSRDAPYMGMFDWAEDEYESKKSTDVFGRSHCSLVHERLKADKGFYHSDGIKITKLMMQCVHEVRDFRPTTKEVVQSLLELRVVRRYANVLGVNDILRQCNMSDYFNKKNLRKFLCL